MKILRSATTVFWLRVTIPVNQELKVKEIVNPRMTFKVNGKAVELQLNDGQSSTFPSEAYFAVEPLIPGDKLEFHRRTHPKFKCFCSICVLWIYFSFHITDYFFSPRTHHLMNGMRLSNSYSNGDSIYTAIVRRIYMHNEDICVLVFRK